MSKGKTTMMPDISMAEILRLIASLTPSNEVQEQVIGENGVPPYPGCWQSLLFESDTIVFWNSENMQASFFLFGLPPTWGKNFVLSRPFSGEISGQNPSQEVRAFLFLLYTRCANALVDGFWCVATHGENFSPTKKQPFRRTTAPLSARPCAAEFVRGSLSSALASHIAVGLALAS